MIRVTVLIAALLLPIIGASSAPAGDLNDFLRSAVGGPVEAHVLWPPVSRLSAGDVVGRSGTVIEFGTSEVLTAAVAIAPETHPLSPDQLLSAAFWPVRFLANDLPRLSLTLRVKDVVRETVEGNGEAPSQGTRVGTVWRALVTIEFSKGPEMTGEQWSSLRQAALDDTTDTVEVGGSAIRLTPAGRVPVAWIPPAGDRDSTTSSGPGRRVAPKRWALLTVASGVYQNLPAANQDWNGESARLVRESLSDWSPTLVRTLDARPGDGLT